MGYERNVVDLFIDIGRNQEHQGKVFEQPQTQSDGDESFSNESYSTYSSLEGEQYESDASIDIKGVVENDRFWESFDRLFLQDFPSSCCQRSSSPLSTNLIMDKLTLPQNKSCTTPKASNTSIIAKVVTEHPASALLALSSESTNSTFDSDCGVGCKQSLEKEEEILKIIELNIVQELKDMFFSKELLREAPSYDSEDEDSSATMLSVISEGSEESSKYEELKGKFDETTFT